jgi:hypothetical protein
MLFKVKELKEFITDTFKTEEYYLEDWDDARDMNTLDQLDKMNPEEYYDLKRGEAWIVYQGDGNTPNYEIPEPREFMHAFKKWMNFHNKLISKKEKITCQKKK